MIPIGNQFLEKTETGFRLSQPTIIWSFTKEQLIAEIQRLEQQLNDKNELLKSVEALC